MLQKYVNESRYFPSQFASLLVFHHLSLIVK